MWKESIPHIILNVIDHLLVIETVPFIGYFIDGITGSYFVFYYYFFVPVNRVLLFFKNIFHIILILHRFGFFLERNRKITVFYGVYNYFTQAYPEITDFLRFQI